MRSKFRWKAVVMWGLVLSPASWVQAQVPLKDQQVNTRSASAVEQFLNQHAWDELFPHRYGKGLKDTLHLKRDFYSFEAFKAASRYFPSFLTEGDKDARKRELAAFLAQIASETSGGWAEAPGGYFKWGLYFLQEGSGDYTDTTKKLYPPEPGQRYYGRGPFQLSWNYNYGQFSEAWFGSRDSLLRHPDFLNTDPLLAFASAIWFWMNPQPPKPACHAIMVGKWVPSAADSSSGRLPGFGATVNVINGGIECGKGSDLEKTAYRYQYFLYFCRYLHVSPGENITCTRQQPFGK
jgi:basic endochitinase B